MSGDHGGPVRWRGRRGRREEGQPASPPGAQPAGPDYPARAAAMSMVPEALWETPQLPSPEDIAAARRVLETVPATIEALTVAQLSAGWEQLQWAGGVMVAAYRCQIAMARSPRSGPPWQVLS